MIYSPAGITVIIATVPPRWRMLACAVESVGRQTHLPDKILIEYDLAHEGPAPTRNRAIEKVDTEWCANLDDDDELLPNHLTDCLDMAAQTGADVVYPSYESKGKAHISPQFDRVGLKHSNFIPTCVLMRSSLLHEVGGYPLAGAIPKISNHPCEDWGLYQRLADAGAHFEALSTVTWRYNRHERNYGGFPW